MHRKHIRRWHKLFSASASLVAILAGLFVSPANAISGVTVDMFWADVSNSKASTLTFYLMTGSKVKNIDAGDFSFLGSATGCVIDSPFYDSAFQTIMVSNCSEGTVALQLGANSISDLSGNWGPAEGAVSDFTTIDRTSPEFTFTNVVQSVDSMPVFISATASENATLADQALKPFVTGEGCFITNAAQPTPAMSIAVSGCKPGADFVVTILANSYMDVAGNLGPTVDVFSTTVTYAVAQTQQLPPPPAATPTATPTPTPTAAPTATPTPTATPSPTATPQPTSEPTQAAAPIVEAPEPPAPPAPMLPIFDEAEPALALQTPALPLTAPMPDLLERAVVARVTAPSVDSPESQEVEVPSEPIAQPIAEPEVISVAANFVSKPDLSWLASVLISGAAILAAVGIVIYLRRRTARMPRLRIA